MHLSRLTACTLPRRARATHLGLLRRGAARAPGRCAGLLPRTRRSDRLRGELRRRRRSGRGGVAARSACAAAAETAGGHASVLARRAAPRLRRRGGAGRRRLRRHARLHRPPERPRCADLPPQGLRRPRLPPGVVARRAADRLRHAAEERHGGHVASDPACLQPAHGSRPSPQRLRLARLVLPRPARLHGHHRDLRPPPRRPGQAARRPPWRISRLVAGRPAARLRQPVERQHLHPARGTDRRRIVRGREDSDQQAPVYAPSGRSVAFVRNEGQIAIVPVDGGPRRILARARGRWTASSLSWRALPVVAPAPNLTG